MGGIRIQSISEIFVRIFFYAPLPPPKKGSRKRSFVQRYKKITYRATVSNRSCSLKSCRSRQIKKPDPKRATIKPCTDRKSFVKSKKKCKKFRRFQSDINSERKFFAKSGEKNFKNSFPPTSRSNISKDGRMKVSPRLDTSSPFHYFHSLCIKICSARNKNNKSRSCFVEFHFPNRQHSETSRFPLFIIYTKSGGASASVYLGTNIPTRGWLFHQAQDISFPPSRFAMVFRIRRGFFSLDKPLIPLQSKFLIIRLFSHHKIDKTATRSESNLLRAKIPKIIRIVSIERNGNLPRGFDFSNRIEIDSGTSRYERPPYVKTMLSNPLD